MLNKSKPEHPPDIYFIRRNDRLMEKYLDQDEMKQLVKEADPRLKNNYNLFRLDQQEKVQRDIEKTSRRNFKHPNDPFLKPLHFNK